MALSDSTDYSLTAREVVYDALRRAGISDISETPRGEDASVALTQLELMLKHWQLNGPSLWLKREGTQALTASTASFALPSDVLRVLSARVAHNGQDIPMCEMTREEYFDLPNKSVTGYPTSFFVDRQRIAPTLYVWPLAPATGYTFSYTYHKRIDDIDDLDNDIEIPKEFLLTVSYNLSSYLCDYYEIDSPRITQRAAQLLSEAEDYDRPGMLRFVPGGC